jgi:2-dehydropantoate 2-reductase
MKQIFIFGGGAVGMALAVHLANNGRDIRLVRTSGNGPMQSTTDITVGDSGTNYHATIPCISIGQIKKPKGILVIATKAFANPEICEALLRSRASGPIVLLQNGLGVERPFIEAGFPEIYRAVLYVTGQRESDRSVSFHAVKPSVLGIVNGSEDGLQGCVTTLSCDPFPFEKCAAIETAVWGKAVVNCAFNSLCPLLDVDNGVFSRDSECLELARVVVTECVAVAERQGVILDEQSVMNQVLQISSGSNHLISTLQDIRNGRPTEIDCLNLEVARIAASLEPNVLVPKTELLGKMISAKSRIARGIPCNGAVQQ